MRQCFPILALLLSLPGCAELGIDLDDPPDQPATQVPSALPPPAPSPEPPVIVHPPVTLPSGPPISLKEAERIANRFRTLHQLATAGLIDPESYQHWARQNQGAFLLLTAPPPVDGLTAATPPYDQIADFLRNLKNERPEIADAERSALLDSLMPTTATRAMPRSLPTDAYGLQSWIALLDQIGSEGVLPADDVAAEKAALALAVGP